ncbi:MAG: O-methyltransferase [Solirubrobacterales bacterium]|nr:O-methyltransferase [Solirubrobacterales bacterium]
MILTESVSGYVERVRSAPDRLLAEMETHAQRDAIPVVVPATGQLLQVLALAVHARRALEVGTAIGVSTLYIARGLAPDGEVVSFEVDAERHATAGEYLERAGVGDRVDLRCKDARAGLLELEGKFDFAFLDGVKAEYGAYFEAVLPLLDDGAVLVIDNVLLSGSVAGPEDGGSERASMMRSFNERILHHPELTATLTPVGDGVIVAVRQ